MNTPIQAPTVLRSEYQKSVANYWNTNQNDPVNLLLGHVDGYYHHHYGIGPVNWKVLEEPEAKRDDSIIRELHRLEHAQAEYLLGKLGPITKDSRLLDAGSGRGGTSLMAHERFGCQVDGVSISEYQVGFANEQAAKRGLGDKLKYHFRNMLDTGIDTGSIDAIWTNETTMYVDLFKLYAEFSRLLKDGGRYVCITGCYNDITGGRSRAVSEIDAKYICNIHPRSDYFKAMAANNLVPIEVTDLTPDTIPYWELRTHASVATGVEDPFLRAYKEGSFHYLLIVADRIVR
ncbi:geranyl diphosphate 2-C-methyltransferase [Nannocystis bainbridge]|uniref:Methyltransferase domain-containing protein n=1 Tax=Nannocystis bainbridge TaxID=2995303 RepID=A0ABT5DZN7_9BACT|nr:geranyl diphosphate 2-C-methyltransferase [Nannocystis bainbridge]MDC0719044.1 methyltransferase domain-containing protein [Nannocystis bainbridge]